MRYNLYRSAQINASAAPGFSSAQAMKALEEVFARHAAGDGFDYLGMSFRSSRRRKGSPCGHLRFSLLCVFLILAASMRAGRCVQRLLARHRVAGAFGALCCGAGEQRLRQIGLVMLIAWPPRTPS